MIQKSAKVGDSIKLLAKEDGVTNEQMSMKFNVSPQMISHMKNDRRVMQQDVAHQAIATCDSPEFISSIIYEFSDGHTAPILNGKNIERHRLALAINTAKEMFEGMQALKNNLLAKPPETLDKNEMQIVEEIFDQVDEGCIWGENLLMELQRVYRISKKKRRRANKPRWKARGWVQ